MRENKTGALTATLLADACSHLREGARRIATSLDLIDETSLWRDHAEHLVSVGNLILHLRGNVSQYLLKGLGAARSPGSVPKSSRPNRG